MSLWSRDQLRIALAPHGLALLRHQGNPAKPIASKAVPCETRDWQSLMPLLERELTESRWRGARAEVVLSNQYVRYVLTPAPGKALSRLEEAGLVAASFREIYGAESTDWRIRVHSQPPEFGLVGAAIDESLAIQIGDLMKRHHYTDWAFSPLASVAAQRHAQAADWWVLAEPGWLCLFNAVGGYWRYLSSQPADDAWRSDLPGILEREARMAGVEGEVRRDQVGKTQTAFIQAVGVGSATPPVAAGWHWRVAPQNSLEHGVLALAMG